MTVILTHRGLDPQSSDNLPESSLLAFSKHLAQGYGLEFDVAFLADGSIGVFHDKDLFRMSSGLDKRKVSQLTSTDFRAFGELNGGYMLLEEMLHMLAISDSKQHALHFKGYLQTDKNTARLISILREFSSLLEKLIIFDIRPEMAIVFKETLPEFNLACSVAKEYDRQRYNTYLHNTLLSLELVINFKDVYSWVWLDEWDLQSPTGAIEKLYSQETFDKVREIGMKIACVSPELHATSPGLLGGEVHPDALNLSILTERLRKILTMNPDAICTDFPQVISQILRCQR